MAWPQKTSMAKKYKFKIFNNFLLFSFFPHNVSYPCCSAGFHDSLFSARKDATEKEQLLIF